MTSEPLVHHELCFGCGRTNLFGLLMELESVGEGRVRGRGFIKQDHQGPVPGAAHPGIVAAALAEALAFAAGTELTSTKLELEFRIPVPVGTFLAVEAEVPSSPGPEVNATATASVSGRTVATARGAYRRR